MLREYLHWEFADLIGKEKSTYGSTDPYEGGYGHGGGESHSTGHQVPITTLADKLTTFVQRQALSIPRALSCPTTTRYLSSCLTLKAWLPLT